MYGSGGGIGSVTSAFGVTSGHNFTCSRPLHLQIGVGSLLQATIILLLSLGIFFANLILILVVNSRRYSKYIHQQPRYLLTSLASNDLAIGVLVTPFGFLPALLRCWPYSETICQIQALLRGALTQQSAAILVCMAVDRYTCMLHPASYHKHSTRKCFCQGCMTVVSLSLVASLSLYSAVVLQKGGYTFNLSGLTACDPSYPRPSIRILAACSFYFPTTMLLMYCYGSAFHANKLRITLPPQSVASANPPHSNGSTNSTLHKIRKEVPRVRGFAGLGSFSEGLSVPASERGAMAAHERRLSGNASRTMAAMSLCFIVLVTPWTIQEVVVACTGSKMPEFLDFIVTWMALSNSFWNPFLYWLLNNHFRRICKELFLTKVLCRKRKSPDGCRGGRVSSGGCCTVPPLVSRELEEKYWGEILERAVSTSSLGGGAGGGGRGGGKCPPPPPPPPPPRRPPAK